LAKSNKERENDWRSLFQNPERLDKFHSCNLSSSYAYLVIHFNELLEEANQARHQQLAMLKIPFLKIKTPRGL
jgi:hypothetical protein